VIGASWRAVPCQGARRHRDRYCAGCETSLRRFVKAAWAGSRAIGSRTRRGTIASLVHAGSAGSCRRPRLCQENGPERIDFKKKLYRQLTNCASRRHYRFEFSGLTMSEIQSDCPSHPERCVIGHPFNPPHLVPLVEIVGGAKTSEATIQTASEFYAG